MCKEELNQVDETEEYVSEVEEQLEQLGLNEEIIRTELQHNPTSVTSEETKNSDFYKENMIITETVGEIFQKLLGYGIDYNNALAVASGLVANDSTLKQLELQSTIQVNNQP